MTGIDQFGRIFFDVDNLKLSSDHNPSVTYFSLNPFESVHLRRTYFRIVAKFLLLRPAAGLLRLKCIKWT